MSSDPPHRQHPHYKAAVEAVRECGEDVGYRQVFWLFAPQIVDAVLPHLRLMIESEASDAQG
jgi:hypothetical protein